MNDDPAPTEFPVLASAGNARAWIKGRDTEATDPSSVFNPDMYANPAARDAADFLAAGIRDRVGVLRGRVADRNAADLAAVRDARGAARSTPGMTSLMSLLNSRIAADEADLATLEARYGELVDEAQMLRRRGWTLGRFINRVGSGSWAVVEDGPTTFGEVALGEPFALSGLPVADDYSAQRDLTNYLADVLDPSGRLTAAHAVYLRTMAGYTSDRLKGVMSTTRDVFVTAALCDAIDESDPPPPDVVSSIRLPFDRVFVTFATPVRPANLTTTYVDYATLRDHWEMGDGLGVRYLVLGCEQWRIVGVVLSAGPGGGLADEAIWVIQGEVDFEESVDLGDGDPINGAEAFDRTDNPFMTVVAAVPARLSQSTLAGFAHSVAALIAIKAPDAVTFGDAEPLTAADAKAARKGTSSFRRHAARGRFSPKVRVIDLTVLERSESRETATGRTVKSHWRRGHFRRVRCGPRGEQWFEPRWIAPVWVEGGHAAEGAQVWRASP